MSAPEPLSAERRAELRAFASAAWSPGTATLLHSLLDQADEAARLAGEVERLRAAMATAIAFDLASGPAKDRLRAALTPPESSGGEG